MSQFHVFGKGQGSESVPKDAKGHAPMWKKKSIFWELPYWQVLEVHGCVPDKESLCEPVRIHGCVWEV